MVISGRRKGEASAAIIGATITANAVAVITILALFNLPVTATRKDAIAATTVAVVVVAIVALFLSGEPMTVAASVENAVVATGIALTIVAVVALFVALQNSIAASGRTGDASNQAGHVGITGSFDAKGTVIIAAPAPNAAIVFHRAGVQ